MLISRPECWVRELKVVCNWVKPPGGAGVVGRLQARMLQDRREDRAPNAAAAQRSSLAQDFPFLAQGRPLVAVVGRAGK